MVSRTLFGHQMSLRRAVKTAVDALHLRPAVERGLVEAGLLGERLQYLFRNRPDPSEAILLAGSGRSGTTWLSELLCRVPGTQKIFEPLRQAHRWQPAGAPPTVRSPYLRPDGEYAAWHMLLERVLSGRCRTYWTDSGRTSFFPDRYLIKEIRANLMLGYIHEHFRPRIVYLLRHPCAVVASRVRLAWRVNLGDLLRQEELVEDHLSGLVGDIELARSDTVASHAIWWAVETRVAARQLETRPHYRAYYEQLVVTPAESLGAILTWLGLDAEPVEEDRVRRRSRTTWKADRRSRQEQPAEELSRWTTQLSRSDQRLVLDWAHRLGVGQYTHEPMPVGS